MLTQSRPEQFATLYERFGVWKVETLFEHRFHPDRKWRFDVAFPTFKVAVEIEGIKHYGKGIGRHQSAAGYRRDCEKYNAAAELGWVVLRYTQMDLDEQPLQVVEQVDRVLASKQQGSE